MIWFYIILVVLTFSLNKLTIKYGFDKINYKREISKKNVEIDEEFDITTIVENNKRLPVTFLQVNERFPESFCFKFKTNSTETPGYVVHTVDFFLMPYQRVKKTYTMLSTQRGVYMFRNASLSLGDFIGFESKDKEVEYLQELVVLPKPLYLEDSLVPYGNYMGDISVRRWIVDDPLMTLGIREYTGREPQKHIHWNSSIKYGKLMVKNFDFTTDNSLVFILNTESHKPFWSFIDKEGIEECISLSRGILEEIEEAKIPYGFTTNSQIYGFYNGENITYPGVGTSHLQYLLEMLGRVSYSITVPLEELVENIMNRSEKYTTYVIVTPRVFKSYIEPIESLNRQVNRLIIISLEEENLDCLSESIIKYVRRK